MESSEEGGGLCAASCSNLVFIYNRETLLHKLSPHSQNISCLR